MRVFSPQMAADGQHGEIDRYFLANGCQERRTLRLHDARSGGQPAESALYINESLWPDLETAEGVTGNLPDDIREAVRQLRELIDLVKTVRYVDL